MKLVFAGTPEVAVPALDALIASGRHEVAAVVTRPDAPAGRGRRLVASPVAERAEEAGIEVLKPVKPRDEAFLARLREIAPDCCPVVAYGALLPRVALDIPAQGWVNLHFSLLPAWRGAAPVQHAVMAGDEITGASTFLIEEGLDSGPVYGTVTEEVRPTDTSGDLLTRLAFAGAGLLVRDHGRDRGRHAEGRAAAGGRGHVGAEDQRRGRACGLGRARAPCRPGRARVYARAGGVDRVPGGAAQVDPGCACS
jgi:methionyl-tRNA formyltransferase